MTIARHFEGEEFPSHCDHCPAELGPGVAYRRLQLVLDVCDSVVGATRADVEHSYELVLCSACATRIEHWATHPLGTETTEELVDELDDQSLLDELEKEAFILGPAPDVIELDVTKWRNVSGVPIFELPERCPRHQGEDYDLVCFDCQQLLQARARQQEARQKASTVIPANGEEANRIWQKHFEYLRPRPCLDPDKMHGAGDQFPGEPGVPGACRGDGVAGDHHMLGKDDKPS